MRIERHTAQGQTRLGIVFGGVLALAAVLAVAWLRLGLPQPVCHFREWTGLACPTCGSTRMVEALLRGDLATALAWNPLVFFALSAVAAWAAVATARQALGHPSLHVVLKRRERAFLRLAAVGALVAHWAYLIWRGV